MISGNKKEIIFIGFAESLSAPEVAFDLLNHNFRLIAFSRIGKLPPLRRIKEIKIIGVTPPEKNVWETIEQIKKASISLNAKILLPLDDAAIWICDQVSKIHDIVVAGAVGENARLALNKRLQLDEAKEAGFNIPKTIFVKGKKDLFKISQLPIVIKPADAIWEIKGRLCKGPLIFCMDESDIIQVMKEWNYDGAMMVQPFLFGTGEGIFGLNGPNGVRKWSAHRRLRTVNPLGSGSSACKSIKISDHPIEAAERMLRKVNWPGMFMIELLRDSNNKLWFMELNGRSWGSMALALRLGLHYPAWTVMQILDPSFEPPESPPWKSIVCRHLGREIIHLLSVIKGKRTFKLIPNYSRMKTLFEVCHFNRNEKWYNKFPGYLNLFLEDTIRSVMGKIFPG